MAAYPNIQALTQFDASWNSGRVEGKRTGGQEKGRGGGGEICLAGVCDGLAFRPQWQTTKMTAMKIEAQVIREKVVISRVVSIHWGLYLPILLIIALCG